jgi:CBS domain-containing protein
MFKNITNLDELANEAIKVKHFATMELVEADPDEPALEIMAWMTANNFDIVPVSNGDQVGFVSKVKLESLRENEAIRKAICPIDKAFMISPNASLRDVLDKFILTDSSWLFVEGVNKPQGIVTLYDLEKPAVSLFLLAKILMLEAGLRRLLGTYTNTPIPDSPPKDDVDGDPQKLSRLLEKVKEESSLVSDLGFSSRSGDVILKGRFKDVTNRIRLLRNHLAHGRSILNEVENPLEALQLINEIDKLLEKVKSKIDDRDQVWDAFINTIIVDESDGKEIFWSGANAIPLPMQLPIFIISAENPFEEVLLSNQNDERTSWLRKLLKYRELKFMKVFGKSPHGSWKQVSFAIEGISKKDACELAKKFGQRAIFELTQDDEMRVISVDEVCRKTKPRCL